MSNINITSTGNDICAGALLNVNALAVGQPIPGNLTSVCLQTLNDLLDSLSTDQAFIYTQVENQVAWTPGQYQYSIGNPTASNTFGGTTTSGSAIITGITNASAIDVTFGINGYGQYVGGTLTDTAGFIPAGTTISSISVSGGTLTMSQNATGSGLTSVSYTIPGNFCFPRPIRIRNGYTRITTSAAAGLDYWFDVQTSLDRYNEIGLKTVPGPWPYLAAYQPTFPYGTLWIYPNPQIAGLVYLFTDYILSEFTTMNQLVSLPQGYNRALKKLLALEFCPIFGKTPSPMLINQAKEAKMLLKSLNVSPVITLRYDSDLVYSRHTDASFIVNGGFV